MSREPHFVRVARALALVTGLAGMAPGCGAGPVGAPADAFAGVDSGGGGTDAAMVLDAARDASADTGNAHDTGTVSDTGTARDTGTGRDTGVDAAADDAEVADAGMFDCLTCDCFGVEDAGRVDCNMAGHIECCVAIGPLAPPDLAV